MEPEFKASQDSVISQSTAHTQSQSPQKVVPTVANSTNNTFHPHTIVPITRTVQVSPHCYAIYSTLHKIPLAVHQFIDKPTIEGTGSREGKDFYQQKADDIKDQKFYINPSYYELTKAAKAPLNYDKGHMAPASNYIGDQASLDLTYTYANCIPQNSYFNRGSWKNLESYCRNLLRNNLCETVEIISGPVFYSGVPFIGLENVYENKQVVMMENGLVVPPKCYKIIKANKAEASYLSAFVLTNDKIIDNDIFLKSLVVTIDKLELMTGLRFNLGTYRALEELDSVGMSKTMGDLHLQFYTKMFKNAKSLADMNAARKQGYTYHVKVDMKCLPIEEKVKLAEQDFESIISEKDWTRTKAKARRKINSLLGLHRDAKQVEALSEELDKKIRANIELNMEPSKAQTDKQYHRWIAGKLYKNNYGYHYPFEEELKIIFPNAIDKEEGKQEDESSQKSLSSQSGDLNLQSPQKCLEVAEQSSAKGSMKKPKAPSKRTPKKQEQNTGSIENKKEEPGCEQAKHEMHETAKKKSKKVYKEKVQKQKIGKQQQQNQEQADQDCAKLQMQISSLTLQAKQQTKNQAKQAAEKDNSQLVSKAEPDSETTKINNAS